MGEIRPKKCEPRELTKDQLDAAGLSALRYPPWAKAGRWHAPKRWGSRWYSAAFARRKARAARGSSICAGQPISMMGRCSMLATAKPPAPQGHGGQTGKSDSRL
mgnify:CR=1 FL=1